MPPNHQKPKGSHEEPRLYDAVLDEFLSWIEESHDEWHRRMEKLHRDLAQVRDATKGADGSKMR